MFKQEPLTNTLRYVTLPEDKACAPEYVLKLMKCDRTTDRVDMSICHVQCSVPVTAQVVREHIRYSLVTC